MVVIDLSSRTEIRSIPGQKIHGVALVPELNRGFVSDGDAGSVILFDLKTLEVNRIIQALNFAVVGLITLASRNFKRALNEGE